MSDHIGPIQTLPCRGQLQVDTSNNQPVETQNELVCVSEYKQIIRLTGLPANVRHSLGLIEVLTTIQPYCLEWLVRREKREPRR